ncbi:hypothetical protein Goarm_012052 [Gossypium armourianum]|uniref:Peptidase A1 domain-containing protein n=1 Tax=Gossypium armourianum TaxID=34283 RepID=A0A7J9IZH3_9ROSI|nr:hypothetical protein [Gossypium armourianum]
MVTPNQAILTTMAAIVLAILALSTLCSIEAQKGGFSVELIHRDSSKSPFYNPLETTSDRVTNALRRSFNRVHRFKTNSVPTTAAESDLTADSGEYLMKISLGTPRFDIVAIADTGSDLIWTQCKPCSQCFKQDAPFFDPSKSSTYRKISCSASQCIDLERTSCSTDHSSFPKTVIGCGTFNGGTFDEKTSGIIGLGGGQVSLISQLRTSVAGKFSYCLLPISQAGNSSKINFGSNAIVSGPGVVSTPLVKKSPDTFYFLTLEAITVGTKRIKFTGSSLGSEEGNIIIDSGTTLTLLPSDFYSEVESAMTSQISAKRIEGPEGLSLCYNAKDEFKIPDVTVHFTNADVKLKPLNTFIRVSDTALCFTFSSLDDVAIYGNLSQMDFLIGYDTQKQTVSFQPTDCSKN